MPTQDEFTQALSDRRFVAQWNAARYFKTLKFPVERRYVEAILAKTARDDKAKNKPWIFGECTVESLQVAMLDAAAAGLSLSPALAHAYLIPYRPIVQFTPGYRGLIALALKGKTVIGVQANLVHKLDPVFKVWTDETGRHLQHEENRGERGEVTHAYCLARFANGGHHVEVLTKAEIEAIAAAAFKRPGGGMVWKSDFRLEMEKKSAVRRSAKWWPVDPEGHLAHMLAVADKFDPLDFDRAESAAGGDLLISEEQKLALHAAITDHGIDGERASDWLHKKAQALGYAAIEHLPAARFDEVSASLKERAKAFIARSGT